METLRSLFLLSILSLALLFYLRPISAIGYADPNPFSDTDFIRTSCNATLYPELCYTSLSRYANAIQDDPARLARVAIAVSLPRARRMANYISNISRQADYGGDRRAAAAVHDCVTFFGDAVHLISDSLKQMRRLSPGESLRFQMSNVQTWISAAITNEYTCTDGFENVSDWPVKTDLCDRVEKVKEFTANALALVDSYAQTVTTP